MTRLVTASLLLAPSALAAEATVLGRLSFEVRPDRLAEFAAVYERDFLPVLLELGLQPSDHPQDSPADGYFARLFEFTSYEAFEAASDVEAWRPALRPMCGRHAERFRWVPPLAPGDADPRPYLPAHFELYEMPLPEPERRPLGPGRTHWRSFDADDGLVYSSLGRIWEDGAGRIWGASDEGHWTGFDGHSWRAGDPCGVQGRTRVVHLDRSGNTWCVETVEGRGRRLFYHDGQTAVGIHAGAAFPTRSLDLVEDPDGILWLDVDSGLYRWDGDGFVAHAVPGEDRWLDCLLADRSGRLWLWSPRGLLQMENEEARLLPGASSENLGHIGNAVEDARGRIWFGGEHGLWLLEGDRLRREPLVGDSPIRSLLVDRRGDLWFAGFWDDQGLGRLEVDAQGQGSGLTRFTTADGLAGNTVSDIAEDHEGAIWVATNAGASRLEPHLTSFHVADGLFTDEPTDVTQDGAGRILYTGRAAGYGILDGDSSVTHPGAPISWGDVVSTESGELWFSERSIQRVHGGRLRNYATAAGVSRLRGRLLDDDGTIWFASDGLGRVVDGVLQQVHRAPGAGQGLLLDRGGATWFGGRRCGLFRYEAGRVERVSAGHARLDTAWVWDLVQDDGGDLWVSAYGDGLMRFDGTTVTVYGAGEGVPTPMIMRSLKDSRGHLWFGTDGAGVLHYDGTTFQTLTRDDGLAGNVVRGMAEDDAGNVWIACSGGLTRYTPPPPSQPPIHLDAVVADRRYESPSVVSLAAGADLVAFEFHGLSHKTRPGAMVYRYRLVGFDEDWRVTRAERVEYEGLPRGDYTFEVVAVDRDLGYSEAPATASLVFHMPYERLAWVAALTVAAIGLFWQAGRVVRRDRRLAAANVALASANARLEAANRQITEATRNKSQFLRRMSHDLRSPMNAIIGYSRILRRRLADRMDEREARNLANIETSSGNLLRLVNDILDLARIEAGRVEVNTQSVDLRQLADECADALASIVRPGVELRRQLPDICEFETDPDRLRQVVMNLLGNAAKFTTEGHIALTLARRDGAAEITVADTGMGIPAEDLPHIFDEFRRVERRGGDTSEGTGLGLSIAKKTVELLGGEIEATSEVGVGTTFTVRLPG